MGMHDQAVRDRDAADAADAAAVCRKISGDITRAFRGPEPVDRLPVRIDPGQEVTFRARQAEADSLRHDLHRCQGGTASIPSDGNRGGGQPTPAS